MRSIGRNALRYTEIYNTVKGGQFDHIDLPQVAETALEMRKDLANIGELMQVVGLIRHQFGLLAEIYHAEGLKQQDYAEKSQVTKGNIFQHLDRLVFRGLLERRREGL